MRGACIGCSADGRVVGCHHDIAGAQCHDVGTELVSCCSQRINQLILRINAEGVVDDDVLGIEQRLTGPTIGRSGIEQPADNQLPRIRH